MWLMSAVVESFIKCSGISLLKLRIVAKVIRILIERDGKYFVSILVVVRSFFLVSCVESHGYLEENRPN